MGSGSLHLLESAMRFFSKCNSVENDLVLLIVVFMERETFVVLRIVRDW